MREYSIDEVKAFLGEAERLHAEIKNTELELEKWMCSATSTTSPLGGERVQTSGNPHKMENVICIKVDIEQEMAAQIMEQWEAIKEIKNVIRKLSLKEYDIMFKKYILFMSWDEMAEACNMSKSNCTTIHGRALVNVQSILNERERQAAGGAVTM